MERRTQAAVFASKHFPRSSRTRPVPPIVRAVTESGLAADLRGAARETPGRGERQRSRSHASSWRCWTRHVPAYRLFVLNAHRGIPTRPDVVHETPFVGPGMRRSPTLSYVPARLSLVPRLFATTMPPDVVAVTVAPLHDGKFSLGTEVNVLPAAIEACRARGGLVVAQVNRHMPWTYGDGVLDPDVVDCRLRRGRCAGRASADDAGRRCPRIGELVAARIADGATLQLGIGMVPDATLPGLRQRRGLAIWSEMFSDGVLALDEAGALDPADTLTASFLYGSARAELLGRPQPSGAGAANRDHERPGPDRVEPCHDVDQHRPAGGPVRAGERVPHLGSHPLRLRRPDRLHRRRAARRRRPGTDGAALLAPQGGHVRRSWRSSTSRSPRSSTRQS